MFQAGIQDVGWGTRRTVFGGRLWSAAQAPLPWKVCRRLIRFLNSRGVRRVSTVA
jgi:hypothetical protein